MDIIVNWFKYLPVISSYIIMPDLKNVHEPHPIKERKIEIKFQFDTTIYPCPLYYGIETIAKYKLHFDSKSKTRPIQLITNSQKYSSTSLFHGWKMFSRPFARDSLEENCFGKVRRMKNICTYIKVYCTEMKKFKSLGSGNSKVVGGKRIFLNFYSLHLAGWKIIDFYISDRGKLFARIYNFHAIDFIGIKMENQTLKGISSSVVIYWKAVPLSESDLT